MFGISSRDPIGYLDGNNLHEFVSAAPARAVDPSGLQKLILTPLQPPEFEKCKSDVEQSWNLDLEEKPSSSGYIVQKVCVKCRKKDCPCQSIGTGDFAGGALDVEECFLEAWYVPASKAGTFNDKFFVLAPPGLNARRKGCASIQITGTFAYVSIAGLTNALKESGKKANNFFKEGNIVHPTVCGGFETGPDNQMIWRFLKKLRSIQKSTLYRTDLNSFQPAVLVTAERTKRLHLPTLDITQ